MGDPRDPLVEYRRKRDPDRTSEPVPAASAPLPEGRDDTFVIQQHHARRLHWDLRLERDGVLVSWAVPRGIPRDPARNHLAVHTEDHPLEYASFQGEIPAGEYGGGRMVTYDRGRYETEKWRDREVIVVFHGHRVTGRYALFQTRGQDWMIHRMDPPEPGWSPMPDRVPPMTATRSPRLPADDAGWGFEMTWDGVRAAGHLAGGQLRLVAGDPDGTDLTARYPELRPLAEALAPVECILDGEVVAFDPQGRVSPEALRPRERASDAAAARRLAARTPVQYLVYDLLWLDGKHTVDLSYAQRRELLSELAVAGPHWQTPPYFSGGGPDARQASREQGLPGVTAKRLDSAYQPGLRSRDWRDIRPTRRR
jgi:bifunctional non-homologous end joining protein LigD